MVWQSSIKMSSVWSRSESRNRFFQSVDRPICAKVPYSLYQIIDKLILYVEDWKTTTQYYATIFVISIGIMWDHILGTKTYCKVDSGWLSTSVFRIIRELWQKCWCKECCSLIHRVALLVLSIYRVDRSCTTVNLTKRNPGSCTQSKSSSTGWLVQHKMNAFHTMPTIKVGTWYFYWIIYNCWRFPDLLHEKCSYIVFNTIFCLCFCLCWSTLKCLMRPHVTGENVESRQKTVKLDLICGKLHKLQNKFGNYILL